MNDILVIVSISVIIIGFLILVGVAIWLAVERRQLSAGQPRSTPQRGSQPAAPQAAASQGPAIQGEPAAAPAASEGQAGGAAPTGSQTQKDANTSGEYPSAAIYDQTMLPEPRKPRTPPAR
jgi:hypothetical protein